MLEFEANSSHVAKAIMTNPTEKPFNYEGVLYMGTDLAVMSQVSFHLDAGESKEVDFLVTMPIGSGTYPVHLGIFSGEQNIGLYKAVEDIMIVVSEPGVSGWIVDDKTSMQTWWPLVGATWGTIFREKYVALVKSNIPAIPEEELYIGYTWVTQMDPIYYWVWTITAYDSSRGIWLCDVEKHYLGLDSAEGRAYWKTQIPTGVPVSFAFYKGTVPEDALRELESSGAADVTNIGLIYWSVNWPLCFRAIIYDLDGFFDILRKYGWASMTGRLLG